MRGDCNGNGTVDGDISNVLTLLFSTFTGQGELRCLMACDANGNGEVIGQVGDAIYMINHSFLGGPDPVAPHPECGPGTRPTDRVLGCDSEPSNCR